MNAIKVFLPQPRRWEAAGLHDVVKQGLLLVEWRWPAQLRLRRRDHLREGLLRLRENLRHDMFARIQSFSFENIDRFSSASLVTRMTTDISNVQMTFMMLIRMAVRSPLMFLFAVIMAFIMGGKLALTFVIVIPVLVFGLYLIAKKAMPAFRAVFKKYDRLNESIEENVRAMRVVKGFAREDYEKDKFGHASRDICKDFTYAERVVALNSPLMQLCIYFNMIFILTVGSKLIITSGGTLIDVGQISAMLTYGFQILMSLMMLSFVYVMLTMSAESARRICEVLDETPSLSSPEDAVTEIKDGSVDFENVSFKYSAKAQKFALAGINLHIDEDDRRHPRRHGIEQVDTGAAHPTPV